jgi:para-nitrobenzyl esterase
MALGRPVVDTVYGPVRGIDRGGVSVFKGIRYAAPPFGDLRFRAPVPPEPWTQVADATEFGFACPQPPLPGIPFDLGARQDEDCLTLNIWAPPGADAKPVMVWLHGGAYVLGSASQPVYDGSRLAGSGDVVVVTVNYRVGAFGFLDLSAFNGPASTFDSNIGLRDALAALQWVQDNIAAFGGDPARVTLFGESAGAGLVTTLLAVPSAKGLFCAAIAQSSPATSVYDHGRAEVMANAMLNELGLGAGEVSQMRQVPVPRLIAATKKLFDRVPVRHPGRLAFVPFVDGDVLPDYPVKLARQGRSHPVPVIIGTNKHESALFRLMRSPLMPITPKAITSMFDQIAAEQPDLQLPTEEKLGTAYQNVRSSARGLSIASDVGFRMPSVRFAEGHSSVAPVYLYRFDYATPLLKLMLVGAAHAMELGYVWGNLGGPSDHSLRLGGAKVARAVSKRMRTRWVNFAAHAKPTGLAGEPEWMPYQLTDRPCLLINERDQLVYDVDKRIRMAWGDGVLNFR